MSSTCSRSKAPVLTSVSLSVTKISAESVGYFSFNLYDILFLRLSGNYDFQSYSAVMQYALLLTINE